MLKGIGRNLTRATLALTLALVTVAPSDGTAGGAQAKDFRVRVSTLLELGKSKQPGARAEIERALTDPHPSVRIAAAAALRALGDPAAVPALESRLSQEAAESVRAQIQSTLTALRGASARPRYIVQLGAMRNNTSVQSAELGRVMRLSARAHASSLSGGMFIDGDDAAIRNAKERKIPVLQLDGQLNRLQHQATGGSVSFQASVEFSVRRVPEQTLKGVLSGAASTTDSVQVLGMPARVAEIQSRLVDGAVESAMRHAEQGLLAAAR